MTDEGEGVLCVVAGSQAPSRAVRCCAHSCPVFQSVLSHVWELLNLAELASIAETMVMHLVEPVWTVELPVEAGRNAPGAFLQPAHAMAGSPNLARFGDPDQGHLSLALGRPPAPMFGRARTQTSSLQIQCSTRTSSRSSFYCKSPGGYSLAEHKCVHSVPAENAELACSEARTGYGSS